MSGDAKTRAPNRVSVVTGDRVCVRCGYNLVGQSIEREPHYQLLICTCPECGTVAAMQDYPVLGRWANRWAMLLAALWALAMFVCFVVPAGATIGMTTGFSFVVMEDARIGIRDDYIEWHDAQAAQQAAQPAESDDDSADTPEAEVEELLEDAVKEANEVANAIAINQGQVIGAVAPPVIQGWWSFPQFEAWLNESSAIDRIQGRSIFSVANWQFMVLHLIPQAIAFVAGCLWAVLLLHKHTSGRVRYACYLLLILGAVFAYIRWQIASVPPEDPDMLAVQHYVMPFLTIMLGVAWCTFVAGLIVGRKIIRSLIVALLPPRLRGSFATLWLVDDLDPPTAGALHRIPGR